MPIDLQIFLQEFHDYLAPRLDVYEQAIYLYVFRHSRMLDSATVVIGFKSERVRLATGIGENGKPMSESTSYKKLDSLQQKGCISCLGTSHKGRILHLFLPNEIDGIVPPPETLEEEDLETMDFFTVPLNRKLLLERENHRCFYTLRPLTSDNFIVEHIVSRPDGDNSYRNCVAASREANNKKGSMSAEDFLRRCFREGFLNEDEFAERLNTLEMVKSGHHRPPSHSTRSQQ